MTRDSDTDTQTTRPTPDESTVPPRDETPSETPDVRTGVEANANSRPGVSRRE